MAKKPSAAKRGRPKSANPKDQQIGLRLDDQLREGTEKYRVKNRLDDAPSAIRHMLRRVLDQDGFLEQPKP
jgi:hypothetical protein